jgi:hypothetical protein
VMWGGMRSILLAPLDPVLGRKAERGRQEDYLSN